MIRKWMRIDLRSLGFFRILVSLLLLLDLLRRWEVKELFYGPGSAGELDYFRDWSFSLFHGIVSDWLFGYALFACFVSYFCLLIGYRTRAATVVSWVLFTSLFRYNHALIHGGHMLLSAFLMWACFLPWGDQFSVDARRPPRAASPSMGSPPHVAILLIQMQYILVYFSSFLAKTLYHPLLPPGTTNDWIVGTAWYYAMNYRTVADGLAPWFVRTLPTWAFYVMNYSVLAFEGFGALLLLSTNPRLRRSALLIGVGFSIGTMMTLYVGDIARIMCAGTFLFVRTEDWDWIFGRLGLNPRKGAAPVETASHHRNNQWKDASQWIALFLGYSNFWMVCDQFRVQPLPTVFRPEEAIRLQRIVAFDQNWDYFWNGPRIDHSFAFFGILDNGTEISLEEAFRGGSAWDGLRAPAPATRAPIDGVVTYYGLLRFRYLDAFFNFGQSRPGETWPVNLVKLSRYLKAKYESRFAIHLTSIRVERIDRFTPPIDHRMESLGPGTVGASYSWKY